MAASSNYTLEILRSYIPFPTPDGHAGLGSTSSRLPQEVSRSVALNSKATLRITRQAHGRIQPRCTLPCSDVHETKKLGRIHQVPCEAPTASPVPRSSGLQQRYSGLSAVG